METKISLIYVVAPFILIIGAILFLRIKFRIRVPSKSNTDIKVKNNYQLFLVSIFSILVVFFVLREVVEVKYLVIYFLMLVTIVYFEEVK
jgi:hypothetical protein